MRDNTERLAVGSLLFAMRGFVHFRLFLVPTFLSTFCTLRFWEGPLDTVFSIFSAGSGGRGGGFGLGTGTCL